MTDRDDIKQPLDHLPPKEERDDEVEQPEYPDSDAPAGTSAVSPDTEAEPDFPDRHGLDSMPTSDR